jgi:probable F420-dependent oxidoreductase
MGKGSLLRLGFNLPQIGPAAGPEAIVRVAAAAEDIGFATLWVADRLLSGALPEVFHDVIDPVGTLTFAAARTTQVRLGTSILNLPWYNPALLARQLTALDVLSNGRLRVGFGVGWMEDEFEAVGISMGDRGKRADEALQVLKAIWTTDPVEFEGTYYTIPKSVIRPKPVQEPHPPIYLAASTPRAMARVARHADGWIPLGLPIDEMAEMFAAIKSMAHDAGRDPDRLEMSVRANVIVTESPLNNDRNVYTGSPDQIASDIAATRNIGASELAFDPTYDPAVLSVGDFTDRMKLLWGLATGS